MLLCPLRLDIDPLPESSPQWLIDEAMVKKHCRVEFGDEDSNLEMYLRAAVEWCENAMHRTVIRREHRWILKEFPIGVRPEIRLPRGLCSSVDSISYYSNGTQIDLTGPSSGSPQGEDWQEDLRSDSGGVLLPPRGQSWPGVDSDVPAPVTITFQAGYASGEIPPELLRAILMATSDGYELRSSVDASAVSLAEGGKTLAARTAMVSYYQLSRWY